MKWQFQNELHQQFYRLLIKRMGSNRWMLETEYAVFSFVAIVIALTDPQRGGWFITLIKDYFPRGGVLLSKKV